MKIKMYDLKNAPVWVQYLNLLNLFLLGFAVGKFASVGFESMYVQFFTFYGCIYGLTIGQFFIPKKEVVFPVGLIRHIREQLANYSIK